MQIAYISIAGAAIAILLLQLFLQDRTRKLLVNNHIAFETRVADLAREAKTDRDVFLNAARENAESLRNTVKAINEQIAESENRNRAIAQAAKTAAELFDQTILLVAKEFKRESAERTDANAQTSKSFLEAVAKISTSLDQKIVEDSLARDGRLDEVIKALQDEIKRALKEFRTVVGETTQQFVDTFQTEEAKRSSKFHEALKSLDTRLEGMVKSTEALHKSLEESVKF
jgi:AraC-like DNA-binding protein